MHVHGTRFFGTIGVWPRYLAGAASLMHIPSPAFDLASSSKASSVTTGRGSFVSRDGEKNRLRCPADVGILVGTIGAIGESATCPMAICGCTWRSRSGG
jgi:hypothetical protein